MLGMCLVCLAKKSRDILNVLIHLVLFLFVPIPCRFVFTSAFSEKDVAVFRRRQDNTLESSLVLDLLLKCLKSNVPELSITELCQSWYCAAKIRYDVMQCGETTGLGAMHGRQLCNEN